MDPADALLSRGPGMWDVCAISCPRAIVLHGALESVESTWEAGSVAGAVLFNLASTQVQGAEVAGWRPEG